MTTESHGPLFSVIVPTYNREDLISETLECLKAQSYRPIDLIIVDDGSTDGTENIVQKWLQDKQEGGSFSIRYFYQENTGPSAARNLGIEKIQGEYVQFLDSDDRISADRLTRLTEEFGRTGADFIHTGFDGFDAETGKIIEKHYARPDENQVELALRGLFWANTLRSAFRSSLVKKIAPWNTNMICFEDREYVERALVSAEKPIAIHDILASARRGGSARVSDHLRSYEGRTLRIFCEEQLASNTRDRRDLSSNSMAEFSSRIFALGFRCKARGWPDLAKRCGELADSMGVELNSLGKRRKLIYKGGPLLARTYGLAHKLKTSFGK